ncbi:hypothetical protein [Nitrobacter sp.]|nr:hypothetical protein [Nitrobacter sp.]
MMTYVMEAPPKWARLVVDVSVSPETRLSRHRFMSGRHAVRRNVM